MLVAAKTARKAHTNAGELLSALSKEHRLNNFLYHRPMLHECARKTTFNANITLNPGIIVRPVIAEAALARSNSARVDDGNGPVHCHPGAPFIRRSACRR